MLAQANKQTNNWFLPAFAIIAAITGFRLITLALSNADVFVDEAQYWLWGQNLDFGYYSKPPLAAWVIRATTDLANSDAAFWIRFPVLAFHAATALILGAAAALHHSKSAAIWVAVSYATMPLIAVGSTQISTDTIMAPFLAAGLLFYLRTLETQKINNALIAGAMIGLAFMAKYAGAYFLVGALLAALFFRDFRLSRQNVLAFAAAFLVVAAPNIIWNLQNDLTTVSHTLDNVDWVRQPSASRGVNPGSLAEFVATQFVVVGPVIFTAIFLRAFRAPDTRTKGLLLFTIPIILLVCVQAFLSRAYGNWAFAAYFAGLLVAVPWLLENARRWLIGGLILNAAFTIVVPVLMINPQGISLGDRPMLVRFVGRDEISNQILDIARANPDAVIVAAKRDILADLFLTGHDSGVDIFSVPPTGRADNYYQQTYPFNPDGVARVLYVTTDKTVECSGTELQRTAVLKTSDTAYYGKPLQLYLLSPNCFDVIKPAR